MKVTTSYSSGFTLQPDLTTLVLGDWASNHSLLIGIHSPTRCQRQPAHRCRRVTTPYSSGFTLQPEIAVAPFSARVGNHPLLIGIHSPTGGS